MPPLIIQYHNQVFILSDGNHRFEALKRENIKAYYVIIWITQKEDYEVFSKTYL